MRTILKYLVLTTVALQYLVGSMGFTVHHCCCKRVYQTTSSITEIFVPYHIHECKRIKEMAENSEQLMFRQWRCCGSSTDSMEHMKYNCQEKMSAPPLYLFVTDPLSSLLNNVNLLSVADTALDNTHIFYNHVLKRRWQDCDSLCVFLI